MNRFESWTYYMSELALVEHQSYSDIEQQSNYRYYDCPYQMNSGFVSTTSYFYPCCPEPFSQIAITLELVPNETTFE